MGSQKTAARAKARPAPAAAKESGPQKGTRCSAPPVARPQPTASRFALGLGQRPAPRSIRVQRKCAACAAGNTPCPHCEEEARLQRAADPHGIRQRSSSVVVPAGGQPLPVHTRKYFGRAYGHDVSDVRVHTSADANRMARSEGALAYTTGRDIVFADGRYAPETTEGQRLLGHELAHVVQQAGAVGGVQHAGHDYDALEREADRAADAAVAGQHVEQLTPLTAPTLQRAPDLPPIAAVSVGLSGFTFVPPKDAKLHAGRRHPQLLGIVLRSLLGEQYTDEFRDQVVKEWNTTPMFGQSANKRAGQYSAEEIAGPMAVEGDPVPSPISWEPMGFRSLLAICAKLGKPIPLSSDKERLLELGTVARQAFGQITSMPKWFTRNLFVAVMANRSKMLEDLAKAVKSDALPADVDPMLGSLAQLAVHDIQASLAVSVAAVDAIRADTRLVHHYGYTALWPSLHVAGAPGADDVSPE
ncbi:MAG: DUF4157 domain-containing protein, partial [Gemmatimonadota bacterium]|nr:DUF4157 domain-containing protein [Gemmatimonadota bacterium]